MHPLSETGRARRRSQLLRPPHDRSVIVAIDHGQFMGPVPGAMQLAETVSRVVAGKPDAIQLTPGSVRRCSEIPGFNEVPLVLRLDTTNVWRGAPLAPSPGYWAPLSTPSDALAAGASAAVAFLLGGWADDAVERDNVRQLAAWSRQCADLGLLFMIEPLPLSGKLESTSDATLVRTLARVASEIGCDILKLDYSGDETAFAELVADAGAPVLARGGPRASTRDEYLAGVDAAIRAGASGVVVGRNVFEDDDPSDQIDALRRVVHSREEAHSDV
jgi:DhnA family fructose-bisphosphate aldolase class Ia